MQHSTHCKNLVGTWSRSIVNGAPAPTLPTLTEMNLVLARQIAASEY
ncbi:MAG TPA: hypothetical protein VKT51_13230 [Candidatus Eremiobacteraceae bacterium]|nr:hypothetical protein [Candidatus Eremiobacteraceae bacterium]